MAKREGMAAVIVGQTGGASVVESPVEVPGWGSSSPVTVWIPVAPLVVGISGVEVLDVLVPSGSKEVKPS